MSINVLKEFLIHFHTYRNVDLINQGLYQIRTRIYYTENNLKYFALPYFFIESKETENMLQTEEQNIKPHNIITNHISENSSEYITKTFLIRYSDEEVEIDEFCYFRLEIPNAKLKTDLMYTIEFDLFFSDALMNINKEKKGSQSVLNNVEFKFVANQTILVNFDNSRAGYLESFIPIIYSDNFSSVLNSSVHMILLDYKLRINNNRGFSIQQEANNAQNINTPGSTPTNANIPIPKKMSTSKKHKEKEQAPQRSINTLIQFFLEDKDIQDSKLEPKVIDEIYEKYVISLINNFLCLKNKYAKLVSKLIDDKIKSEMPFFMVYFI